MASSRHALIALIAAAALSGPATLDAQQPAAPVGSAIASTAVPSDAPALTDAQKQQVVIAAQQLEIWKLREQQAVAESAKAQAALQQLLASLTPAGYQLNDRLELVKIPAPTKEPDRK